MCKVDLLLEFIGLSLELGGFLAHTHQVSTANSITNHSAASHLGHGKQVLGNVNDAAQVLDAVDARLDGIGVLVARRVQDALDLIMVALGPLSVHGASVGVDTPVDGQEGEEDDALLVDDVELVADGRNGQAGARGQDGRLGGDAVAREGVEDRRRGILGLFLRHAGLEAGGGGGEGGGQWGGGSEREGGTEAGGAWRWSVSGFHARHLRSCGSVYAPNAALESREAIMCCCFVSSG